MNGEGDIRLPGEGDIRVPVIVISDVHLGSERSNYRDFRDFIGWLSTIGNNRHSIECNGNKFEIRKPGTIVLLGDILELWEPRGNNRNVIVKDILLPLSVLSKLDCDINYVVGNHDEDLWELNELWNNYKVKFPYGGKSNFKILDRTFPERTIGTDDVDGIKIGEKYYAFLHGHQFDRGQYFHRISRWIEKKFYRFINKTVPYRFDPIDWIQDFANVSFTKKIGFNRNLESAIFGIISLIFIGFTIYIKSNSICAWSVLGLLWMLVFTFVFITTFPKIASIFMSEIWRKQTIVEKCKSIDKVVDDDYREDYGKHIKADIIVFGHTHNAGECQRERLFINTGSWVTEKECDVNNRNTFLYIDEKGHHLLKWDSKSKSVTCFAPPPKANSP
jgi:UDP-2,3-diacylglucosamine pyrophosphatase LpxH